MYYVQLSNKPRQQFTTYLESGDMVEFTFEFKPNQLGWFFGFKYNNEEYQNIRLTTSYNVLRAYRNWLPFGLRCDTFDSFEPMNIDDFNTRYALLYILEKEDLDVIESTYYAKV